MTNEIPDSIPHEPTAAERHEMIATAAYYLAERRGFAPGQAEVDWLAAELQIDALLAEMRRRGLGWQALTRTGLRNALHVWVSSD
jgi:hypothetical protein